MEARDRVPEDAAGILAIAPLLGVPGTAEIGTTSMGTPLGFLTLLAGTWVWGRGEDRGIGRARAVGLLFGLAAAARTEMVLAIPAFLALAFLPMKDPVRLVYSHRGPRSLHRGERAYQAVPSRSHWRRLFARRRLLAPRRLGHYNN